MITIKTVEGIREALGPLRDKSVGLVPTMGFLHKGHLSLVRRCRDENDVTVVSIFVNPTQFGPNEDFERYPRDPVKDAKMLTDLGVDYLFAPDVSAVYPDGFATYVEVERLGDHLCGRSRPSHFRGVTTVVLKLFNIVQPDHAYFGQKDAQQAVIIRKMVQDLDLPLDIRVVPIVRDEDGLALSSRNIYLSPAEREAALCLPRALARAGNLIETGKITSTAAIRKEMEAEFSRQSLTQLDYIEVVSLSDLQPIDTVDPGGTLVAAAVFVGNTRLIDNFVLGEI